ncbi:MAG: polysaccharide deacetylase family protein [Tissierellia bacterium]|nr:polysaccharide deacetylase family protein [Tissierellia bacterium]
MKFFNKWLIMLSFVLLLTGCTSSSYQNDINVADAAVSPLGENESVITRVNINMGEDMETLIENHQFYSIKVNYPILNSSKIDALVKAHVYDWVREFEDAMSQKSSESSRGELVITYSIARPIENLVGITFNVMSTDKVGTEGTTLLKTINVDIKKDTALSLEDLFQSSPLPIISKALTDYFNTSKEFSHKQSNPKMKTSVQNAAQGNGTYSIGPYGLQVIFQRNSLLDKSHKAVIVDIPYNAFAEHLKEEYIPLKQIVVPAGEDAYIVTNSLPTPYIVQRYKDQCRARGVDISNIDPEKPMIALTFDDGPNNKSTVKILDILKKHNVRATFFILGSKIENNQEVLKRMVEEHHDIGNHSYSHPSLTNASDELLKKELAVPKELAFRLLGVDMPFIRPPFGAVDANLKQKSGLPLIMWSVDTNDWKSRSADAVYEQIMKNPKDGDIVLMHDIYDSTAEAVERAIPELQKMGFQIVTVSDMYYLRGIKMDPGKTYFGLPMKSKP